MSYSADDLRRLLAENAAHAKRAESQDAAIRESAKKELERVNTRLSKMQPGQVALSPALSYDYQRLVDDRWRLSRLTSGR